MEQFILDKQISMSHIAFFKCFHLVFQQVRIVVSIDPDLSGKYLTTLNFGHFHDLRMMTMINLNMMIITGHSHHSVWCCHQVNVRILWIKHFKLKKPIIIIAINSNRCIVSTHTHTHKTHGTSSSFVCERANQRINLYHSEPTGGLIALIYFILYTVTFIKKIVFCSNHLVSIMCHVGIIAMISIILFHSFRCMFP